MNSDDIENSAAAAGGDSSGADEPVASVDYDAAGGSGQQAEALYRDTSSGAAADAAESAAGVRGAASALADSGQEKLGQAAGALSEQIRKVSTYFENRGLEEVLSDARRLVQRNPELFVAGGVVVGFALSRLLTSVEQGRAGRRHW
jgi:hypothetical protein